MDRFFDGNGKVRISASHSLKYAQGGVIPEMTDWNIKNQIQPLQQQPEIRVVAEVVDIANALDNYTKIQTLAGLGK